MDRWEIEEVLSRAVEATLASTAGRRRAMADRRAWRAWRERWEEVQAEVPELRRVLVCLSCERFCDGQGTWVPMPPGLAAMLWRSPAMGVLHGVCHSCLAQMLGSDLSQAQEHVTSSRPG